MNYIGIDHHKQYSYITLLDVDGKISPSSGCEKKEFVFLRLYVNIMPQ